MIYLNNNTTTSVAPEVLDAMAASVDTETTAVIESARLSVAKLLGVADANKIAFTENLEDVVHHINSLVTQHPVHVITSELETHSIRYICNSFESERGSITRIGIDSYGMLDLGQLKAALTAQTAVVLINHADSELGNIQPINEITKVVKDNSNSLIYVDGTNAAGKIKVGLASSPIDFYYIAGDTFHAPEGIGALFSLGDGKCDVTKKAEDHFVQKIIGIGVAADLAQNLSGMEKVRRLRDHLESEILEKIPNSRLNGLADPTKRLPNITNISFENTNGEAIVARLLEAGICVSTSSACSSQGHTASPLLQAMGVPYSFAMGSILFSLSRYNTDEEIGELVRLLPGVIADLRRISGYGR